MSGVVTETKLPTIEELTPTEVVRRLDEHIIGQDAAKRAVAIALRNRWRWRQLPREMRREITPKNILMIGPTGVGKTEITRRLARITGAPFIKIEATKYTEVGYYGRDVESMVRDLVDAAVKLVKQTMRADLEDRAAANVERKLLDLLVPPNEWVSDEEARKESEERHRQTQDRFREMLANGSLDHREVEIDIASKQIPDHLFSKMGLGNMETDFQQMFDKVMPTRTTSRTTTVKEARRVLLEQEIESLMDQETVNEQARHLAEESGMIFIDEMDKICGPEGQGGSADVSRQGVQRDLLPIVEGTVVQTRYGNVSTEHILFIAAGAFHRSRPSDLMPELQGRFPIRVELDDLTEDDFVRILSEPSSSLTKQYRELLAIDGVDLSFSEDGIAELARIAFRVNQSTQNIGARRLHTILERLLEEISFTAPSNGRIPLEVNAAYVRQQLSDVSEDEDLSRFIL